MTVKKRFFTRHPVALRVRVRTPSGWTEMTTLDVSRRGVFLRTDEPLDERKIAQLRISLPSGKELDAMGHVRRVVGNGEALSGMGVEFFVMSREAEDDWDAFVLEQSRMMLPTIDAPSGTAIVDDALLEVPVIRQSAELPLPRDRRPSALVREETQPAVDALGHSREGLGATTEPALTVVNLGPARDERSMRVADVAAETVVAAAPPAARSVPVRVRPVAGDSQPFAAGGGAGGDAPPPVPEREEDLPWVKPTQPKPNRTAAAERATPAPEASSASPIIDPEAASRPPARRRSSSTDSTSGLFITVLPNDLEQLRQFIDRRLRLASVFLRSSVPCSPGQPVDVAVVHPSTDAEVLVSGTVARVIRGEGQEDHGFLLRFDEIEGDARTSLIHFVTTGHPEVRAPTAVSGETLDVLRERAEANPLAPEAWMACGWSLLVESEATEDAADAFQQALMTAPDQPEVHEALALAYALQGDAAKAFAFIRSFRQLAAEQTL
ncbi:MAG: hypothetical protein RIT45_3641 [Pseudomonadota bacterium]|jgi:hypothetical protein